MLNHDEALLIRRQVEAVAPLGYAFGAEFFARIFWAHGWLRHRLPKDIFESRGRVCGWLETLAAIHDQPAMLDMFVADLQRQGCAALLDSFAWAAFGEALLSTLRSRLGAELTPEAQIAWLRLLVGVHARLATDLHVANAA